MKKIRTLPTVSYTHLHTLTVTGGSEKVKAYTSFSYYDQQSIYKNNTNNLQRYNYRTNLIADFKEVGVKVTSGIEGYLTKSREPLSTTGGDYGSVWSHIQNKLPWENAYNQYGQLNNIPDNPLAEISPEAGYSKGEIATVSYTHLKVIIGSIPVRPIIGFVRMDWG